MTQENKHMFYGDIVMVVVCLCLETKKCTHIIY